MTSFESLKNLFSFDGLHLALGINHFSVVNKHKLCLIFCYLGTRSILRKKDKKGGFGKNLSQFLFNLAVAVNFCRMFNEKNVA